MMKSPIQPPEGDWWNERVNRRETIWLGLSGVWAVTLFGWMAGWMQFGEQNQVGETLKLSTADYREKVGAYKQRAGEVDAGLVPPGDDVYVGAMRYAFDGLPAVLETGREYVFHLGTYDVQHGFSVRQEDTLSKQLSLQMLPGYEWKVPMQFDDPGTYHVVCNEFCGTGHRTMHATFVVRESVPDVSGSGGSAGNSGGGGTGTDDGDATAYDGWLTGDARGGAAGNWEGSAVDETGADDVTVTVGPGGEYVYEPAAVRVSPGTTVTFEWASPTHNVLVESAPDGADWSGHEPIENEGFSLQHTFEDAGVYEYYCQPHLALGMKGVVEVV
ncbi:plastocyanin/azurin family copper-binding protein [Haloplanus pelagicus]|jgi:halocyanin-like protein|uniref:plastocyanin/azurin family copper-binding protein n=1 Tax=Haloplanus pelagicus TaxID=2949995 RepID=UPI00203E1A71|nr:plastocyanin/azurin family copper-binding protein [Haloplanus sp. HW8-1]